MSVPLYKTKFFSMNCMLILSKLAHTFGTEVCFQIFVELYSSRDSLTFAGKIPNMRLYDRNVK